MLDSTIELISLAASNSLAVFCFCNLIIAVLLVGSSKPTPQFDQVVKPINAFPINNDEFKKNRVSSSPEKGKDDLVQIEEEEEEEEKVSSAVSIDMVENGDETPDQDDDNDDHDDDELRKRVEEFIEKTNRRWRAEKMRTYIL